MGVAVLRRWSHRAAALAATRLRLLAVAREKSPDSADHSLAGRRSEVLGSDGSCCTGGEPGAAAGPQTRAELRGPHGGTARASGDRAQAIALGGSDRRCAQA